MQDIIQESEVSCQACKSERARRHRVLTRLDKIPDELHKPPFSTAPALYSFNVPRYFSTLLRAREFAKQQNFELYWCYARDVPLHAGDRELNRQALEQKLYSWLRRHDQQTGHLPSIIPLVKDLPVRLTESVDREKQLYRGRRGVIYGWTLDPRSLPVEIDDEYMLDRLPLVIYIYFQEADWRVGKLPKGVYPLKPRSRTWTVNKYTKIEARRTGFWIVPDFGSTAHMIQGATLAAAFVDMLEACTKVSLVLQIAAYVCLSRVKTLASICVMQPFSPLLFSRGPPKGPDRLIRKLRGDITVEEALDEWRQGEDETGDAALKDGCNPMRAKHLCASCYLRGKEEYMFPAKNFGVDKADEFYAKYVAQGCWTRCLQCQKKAGVEFKCTSKTDSLTEKLRSAQSDGLACRVCSAKHLEKPWAAQLECNTHGCSVCYNIFPKTEWSIDILKKHAARPKQHLVCQKCTKLGYTPTDINEHQCEECMLVFGHQMFNSDVKKNSTRQTGSRKICKDSDLQIFNIISVFHFSKYLF